MFREIDVKAEIVSGLVFICAYCERYWQGKDKGLDGCGRLDCGSPMYGRMFEQYKGPFEKMGICCICYVCGKKRQYKITRYENLKVIGLCGEHLLAIKDYDSNVFRVEKCGN